MQDSPNDCQRPEQAETVFSGKKMGLLGQIANILSLGALAVFSVGFVWVMSSLPRVEGRIPAKGLEYPATITRDHQGIPFVTARSGHDAYFAMGWIHAQDRMWQMELQRRIGAGRLAEIVGPAGLKNDRFMRTMGLYRLAENSVALLDAPTQAALQAYADGVNAWIGDNRHRLPPEFMVLRTRPEPWSPADSLVWGRIMALQLTADWRDEALRAKLAEKLPRRRLNELWPDTGGGPITVAQALPQTILASLPETAAPRLASNVMAVSAEHSTTGAPLLANDPHLAFQAPDLWYLLSVEAPGLHLTGAMVPGIPFHLIAHNGRIAWGTTTTHADTVDLFLEKTGADETYQTPKGMQSFVIRHERIAVKGAADEDLLVRESRHGPIISDLAAGQKDGQVVALRTTALEPDDRTAQSLYHLNRAVDWRSFVSALADFSAPVQNFAFADTVGTIGFITAGRVPVRAKADGFSPASGWTNAGEWTGWIAFARMPRQLDPKSGIIVNANNQVVDDKYPYRITAHWPDGYRAQRIDDLLNAQDKVSPQDLSAIQADTVSLAALELKELLEPQAAMAPRATQAAEMIAAWDGNMDKDRPEPLIFNVWLDKLWQRLLGDELGDDLAAFRRLRPRVLGDILTVNRHWCDDVTTPEAESCDTQIAQSLDSTLAELDAKFPGRPMEQWRWGDLHQAVFANPVLSHVPLLNRLSDSRLAHGGDDFTVNRGSYIPGDFTQVHGAGLRVVFDLGNLDNSTFILAGGQSGNPLSRHYADMLTDWVANKSQPITKPRAGAASITLEPSY